MTFCIQYQHQQEEMCTDTRVKKNPEWLFYVLFYLWRLWCRGAMIRIDDGVIDADKGDYSSVFMAYEIINGTMQA
jgi:hypothetical protein